MKWTMKPMMKPMLIALAAVAIPASVAAQQTIDDDALRQQNAACIERCTQTRSYTACAETCGCITGEMRRHWTQAQFEERNQRLSADPADPTVGRELQRIAGHCARRSGMR